MVSLARSNPQLSTAVSYCYFSKPIASINYGVFIGYAALGVASSTTRSMTSNGAGSDAWIFYFSGGVPKSADGW